MDTNAVVGKHTTRGAAVKTGTWLGSSLLVLVLGIAACGQTLPQAQRAHPKIGDPQQTCVPVGRDSCYYTRADSQSHGSQQTCVQVGRDSCYLLIVRR
jgi:hypothetical protein